MVPEELVDAVKRGVTADVSRLLKAMPHDRVVATVNGAVDRHGVRLLHLAAKNNDVEMIKLLLAMGADPNTTDSQMQTPLAVLPPKLRRAGPAHQALVLKGAVDDPEYFKKQSSADGTDDKVNFVDQTLLRKAFAAFLLPFVVLMLYNGPIFCLGFTIVSVLYYMVMMGYIVTEITIKPPWYHPSPKAKTMSLAGLPAEWRGLVHDPKTNLGIDYEDVEFKNNRGKTLRGWFVAAAVDAPEKHRMGIIFVHGGGRDRRTWLRHLPLFHKAGYSCLLFDMQEHGCSDGTLQGLGFGMAERYDVLCAVQYMRKQRGFDRIGLVGTSMGASSSIMAAAIDHHRHIDLVIAENPLLTAAHLQRQKIAEILDPYFRHTRWSKFVFSLFQFVCSNWLNLRIGNKPSKGCQAMHSVAKVAPRPLLLMHGTYDQIVPKEHSERLFADAKEPKELWLAPGATHVCLYDTCPEEFEARVLSFLRKYGGGGTRTDRH